MATFRGFIAIELDITPSILDFEKELKNIDADMKVVEPENIHITLKFLGDLEENLTDEIEKIIKDAVKNIQPFSIKLQGTGVFPNQNYIKVIWIGIKESQYLETIAQTINNNLGNLGFKKEKRGFSPHLTIARVKTAKNKHHILKIIEKYDKKEFSVQQINSITLKKSDLTSKGPVYTTIKEVAF